MIVKYRSVLSYTFILIFFLAVDLCKIFIKNKINYYWVPFFGTLSHIFLSSPPYNFIRWADSIIFNHYKISHK